MKGSVLPIIVIVVLSVNIGVVSSQQDYLSVDKYTMNPKEKTKSGEPITADIFLKRVGKILPDESRLNLTIDLVEPKVEISIDDEDPPQTFVKKEIEILLPPEGVSNISIKVNGNAPTVKKRMELRVIYVQTYVQYHGVEGEYQEEIPLTLEVSSLEIRAALDAIDIANEKTTIAESIINTLKDRGVDTVDLESRLQSVIKVIDDAKFFYDSEEINKATESADNAIDLLDGIITDANEIKQKTEQKSALTRYALIGVGVVVAIIILLFVIRGRREELG